jgi:hypothetical protein
LIAARERNVSFDPGCGCQPKRWRCCKRQQAAGCVERPRLGWERSCCKARRRTPPSRMRCRLRATARHPPACGQRRRRTARVTCPRSGTRAPRSPKKSVPFSSTIWSGSAVQVPSGHAPATDTSTLVGKKA